MGMAASNASAGQVEKKDSWVLNEYSVDGTTICEASTEDRGVIRHYTLKIQKAKNSHMPVEIFLHENGKAEYGPIAIAAIGSEIVLFNQSAQEAKSQSFWNLPDETKLIVDLLKSAEKTFVVKAYGESKGRDLKFALKGAAHILAAMEKRCNQGKALVDARLSALANHPAAFDQNPKVFDATALSEIRATYYEIAARYDQLLQQEAQLKKLADANAPAINERDALRAEKANLLNQKIPALKQDIQATTLRIDAGEKRLAQLKTEIVNADKQRALAQSRYDEAYKKIEPHLPKYKELVNALNSAKRSLNSALSEVDSAESEIDSNLARIQQLEAEVDRLTYAIQRLRNQIPQAQVDADRAYREYQSFNAEFEIRRRLNESHRYRALAQESDRLRDQARRERDALRTIERELGGAKSSLIQCQAVPENNCDALKTKVADLEIQVRAKESEVSRLESQLNSAKREMESIERDIERDVRRIQDRLRDEYEDAAERLSNLNAQLTKAEGDRRDIVEYQLPTLKNRNAELRDRIASLERLIVSLRQEVARADAELKRFDQSVGFSKLEDALEDAESKLELAEATLESLIAEEARLKVQVPQDKSRLIQLNETLKASEQRLAQVIQRIAQLDQALASFDNAKAAIEQKMAAINAEIKATQDRYVRFFL